MFYKNIMWLFFISAFTSLFAFSSLMLFFDPLKIMHEPFVFKDYLQRDMRQQAAGIIKNYDFDGIIMGSSMLENTSSKEASKKLEGDQFFNLSLSGSDLFERSLILNYALKHKNTSTVLYALNNLDLYSNRKGHENIDFNQWSYLYDDNANAYHNFIQTYFNHKYINCIFLLSCMGNKVDFDRPNAWYMMKQHSKRFGGLDKWFAAKNSPQIKNVLSSILQTVHNIEKGKYKEINNDELFIKHEDSKKYFNETIIQNIAEYRNTHFVLIVTPASRISYALLAQYDKERFALYEMNLKYLVSVSERYSNMKIYAWGNEPFLDDIANYKDTYHYEYKYNSYMLDQIQKGNGLLTASNVDEYLKTFKQKAVSYDLTGLGKEITKYLEKDKK